MILPDQFVTDIIRRALDEDLGSGGDITSALTIPESENAVAVIRTRQTGIIAGVPIAEKVFKTIDPSLLISCLMPDGTHASENADLMRIEGSARSLMAAERTALNFIGHLSGIATETHAFARLIAHTKAKISCTRKTTPGLRILEKYAVFRGGGRNHRMGLYDAILIKDNHIAIAGGIRKAVLDAIEGNARKLKIEVEIDTPEQLADILDLNLDAVLLDNMNAETLRKCVSAIDGRFEIEASGGITSQNIVAIAETGVDIISVGRITHSARNFDVGLDCL